MPRGGGEVGGAGAGGGGRKEEGGTDREVKKMMPIRKGKTAEDNKVVILG